MSKRKVIVNLRIEFCGNHYKLVIDRKATSQTQKHCDKCDIKGLGLCFWDDERNINPNSMTANMFCQDISGYRRWFGYWKREAK